MPSLEVLLEACQPATGALSASALGEFACRHAIISLPYAPAAEDMAQPHPTIDDICTLIHVATVQQQFADISSIQQFYSPVSREVKQMLHDLYLRPAPMIIEVDLRVDEAILAPLLFRVTGRGELPILLVGGRPLGTIEEIRYLKKKGELQKMLGAAGAEVYGAKRKQKKIH